jgi:hypothetical protein
MLLQNDSLDYKKVGYETKGSPMNERDEEVMWIFVNSVKIKKGNDKSCPTSTKNPIISN